MHECQVNICTGGGFKDALPCWIYPKWRQWNIIAVIHFVVCTQIQNQYLEGSVPQHQCLASFLWDHSRTGPPSYALTLNTDVRCACFVLLRHIDETNLLFGGLSISETPKASQHAYVLQWNGNINNGLRVERWGAWEAKEAVTSQLTQTSLGLSGSAIYWAAIFETITVHFTGKERSKIRKNESYKQ